MIALLLALAFGADSGIRFMTPDEVRRFTFHPQGYAHGRGFALGSCRMTLAWCPGYDCNETTCDTIWAPDTLKPDGMVRPWIAGGDISNRADTGISITAVPSRFFVPNSVTFTSKRHGDLDLDELVDRIDSVLDGKLRRKVAKEEE